MSATAQVLGDSSSEISESRLIEQQHSVNKKSKENKNWTVYIVTTIVQTLEDVCVSLTNPQREVNRKKVSSVIARNVVNVHEKLYVSSPRLTTQ